MSSAFGLPTFSLAEMDDVMEVSSEPGHNGGDEDIDIDIDLTADQVDEDYVLEDATSNAGLDEDFAPQPSPTIVNDDPMMDEEELFHEQSNGFVQHEETDTMDHEAPTMSLDSAGAPITTYEEDQTLYAAGSEELKEDEIENTMESVYIVEQSETGPNEDLYDADDTPLTAKEVVHSQLAEALDAEDSSHPSTVDHGHLLTNDINSPAIIQPESQGDTASDNVSQNSPPNISVESGKFGDLRSEIEPSHLLSQVVVMYQSSNYVLFSASESADPDSFFLSDFSIAEKPLTHLFEAIRSVIHGDLGGDEELHISVEDLGLEIMENSGSCQDLTFAEIVNLHKKLLENDGVESFGQLHLRIGSRPNFALRYANLAKSAADGKGLSEVVELIEWDEHSDIHHEFQNPTNHQEDDQSATELPEEIGDYGNVHDEPGPNSSLHAHAAQEPIVPLDLGQIDRPNTSLDLEHTDSLTVSTPGSGQAPGENTDRGNLNGEYDEDGDLIDYSDEEEPDVPARQSKKAASDLSKLETDYNRDYNEFSASERAKEDEYRRRSKSLQVEEDAEDAIDNSAEQQAEEGGAVGKDNNSHDLAQDIEDGLDYDDDDHGDSYVEAGDRTQLTNDDELYQYDDQLVPPGNETQDEANDHKDYGGNGLNPQSQNEDRLDEHSFENRESAYDEEIEFDEHAFTQPETFQGTDEIAHVTSLELPTGNSEKVSADTIFGASSTVGSDSDKTLEKQPDSDALEEDEINYDDDDDEQVTVPSQPAPPQMKAPAPTQPTSIKRPRAEEASDEGMSTRNKDAKRPKS